MVSTVYISIIARLVSDVNNKKPKRPGLIATAGAARL
jgi:hypothetical protein